MDLKNIEYRLLTSTVVKDMYYKNRPSAKLSSEIGRRAETGIVSWEYNKKMGIYLICYIDVYGLPVWIYNFSKKGI